MRPLRFLIAAAAAIPIAACVHSGPPRTGSNCRTELLERIYFGGATPRGFVDTAAWDSFVALTVTPRFPSGLTVTEGRGQWRDGSGKLLSEPSRILEVVQPDSIALHKAVDEIISAYKTSFSQEEVLEVRMPVEACLK